jgi:nucleoside-diphosphate-sugar epimerase
MANRNTVLVTGAGGFVGSALAARLVRDERIELRAASRSPLPRGHRARWIDSSGFGPKFDWLSSLDGVDTVVHLAGRAHMLRKPPKHPECEFFAINRDATRRLAEQSAKAGARRFVLISTVGVLGDSSSPGKPLTERDPVCPYDAYTRSKAAGELVTLDAAAGSAMQVTILRPTMVYGPNAPGNFGRLVRLVRSGFPLPFGSIQNARSFLSLDNLVELIHRCITHPSAAGQTFVLSDGEDLSTSELAREIASGIGRAPRMLPLHPSALELGLHCLGRSGLSRRILGSLQVDASLARQLLEWKPSIDVRTAIRKAAHETRA